MRLHYEQEPTLPKDLLRVDNARRFLIHRYELRWIYAGLKQLVVMGHLNERTGVDAIRPDLCNPGVSPVSFTVNEAKRWSRDRGHIRLRCFRQSISFFLGPKDAWKMRGSPWARHFTTCYYMIPSSIYRRFSRQS